MGADHPKSPTELRQYLALLRQRDDAGQPFIIVGGHAANFWAEFYSEREPKLKASLPFTSKDLDIIGNEKDAKRVADAIGWHLSPPTSRRRPGTSGVEFRTRRSRIGCGIPFGDQGSVPSNHHG